jgi:hypothetical protein
MEQGGGEYHSKHLIDFICRNGKVLEVYPTVGVECIVELLSYGSFLDFGTCEELLERDDWETHEWHDAYMFRRQRLSN